MVRHFPFPCQTELELRVGAFAYDPANPRSNAFKCGVQEDDFWRLKQLVHNIPEQEVWDHCYRTADRKTKRRVSYDSRRNFQSCICKSWVNSVSLQQCIGHYDARLNVCREMDAAVPSSGRPYIRHKMRSSSSICEGRWRLDLTRVFQGASTQYEVEIEASDITAFLKNAKLMEEDINYCLKLLKHYFFDQQSKDAYNCQNRTKSAEEVHQLYNYLQQNAWIAPAKNSHSTLGTTTALWNA